MIPVIIEISEISLKGMLKGNIPQQCGSSASKVQAQTKQWHTIYAIVFALLSGSGYVACVFKGDVLIQNYSAYIKRIWVNYKQKQFLQIKM